MVIRFVQERQLCGHFEIRISHGLVLVHLRAEALRALSTGRCYSEDDFRGCTDTFRNLFELSLLPCLSLTIRELARQCFRIGNTDSSWCHRGALAT